MNKTLKVISVIAVFAIVGAIWAQNRAESNTQSSGQSSKASASSSAGSSSGSGSSADGSGTVGPWRDPNKDVYVIIYRPGRNWINGKPVFEQDLMDHGQYMTYLMEQNILLLAGPFMDNTGGEAVIQVESPEQAVSVVENDPAVKSGVFTAELHPWMLIFENTGRSTTGSSDRVAPKSGGGTVGSSSQSGGG